jgi:hypothetical protein
MSDVNEEIKSDDDWLMRIGAIEGQEEEREYEHTTIIREDDQNPPRFEIPPNIVDDNVPWGQRTLNRPSTDYYTYILGDERRIVTEETQSDITKGIRERLFDNLKRYIMDLLGDPDIPLEHIQTVLNELVAFGELTDFRIEQSILDHSHVIILRKGQYYVRLIVDMSLREQRY